MLSQLRLYFKRLVISALVLIFIFSFHTAKAWGPEGHTIVARLALKIVNDDVRQNVLNYLGGMPIDTAANWMDIMKSNTDYDFMRPWYYVDFAKGILYKPSNDENIVNRLQITYNELLHKTMLCDAQIKFDLLVFLHLLGDLHMPLHTGYDVDLGGNKVMVQYDTMKTHNLHRFWDEDIIRLGGISYSDCLNYYTKSSQNYNNNLSKVDFQNCMLQSRSLLGKVYDFPGFILTENYLEKNKVVVTEQLVLAAVHLAEVLNKLFSSPAKRMDFNSKVETFKNGIPAAAALSNIGKIVTICEQVFNVRSTDKITQINLGGKFPNNPLTIIVFAKDYSKFKDSYFENLNNKNICVKGKIELYKDKAQIFISNPNSISLE